MKKRQASFKSLAAALLLMAGIVTIPASIAQTMKLGVQSPLPGSRIRIVPQTSEEELWNIEQSKDKSRLLTHDQGESPKLWDGRTLTLLKVLSGHESSVIHTAFSPDGKRLMTLTPKQIRVWDSEKGKLLVTTSAIQGDKGYLCASFSPDNKSIAAGLGDGRLQIFDLDKAAEIKTVKGHEDPIFSLSFAPNGQIIATGAGNQTETTRKGSAKVWTRALTPVAELKGHTDIVRWIEMSPDAKNVLTTSVDGKARVFDAKTGKLVFAKPHHIAQRGIFAAQNVFMSALYVRGGDNWFVLAADAKGTMDLFDPISGEKKGALKGHTEGLREIRKTVDGRRVGTYSDDLELKVWDVAAQKELPFTKPEGEFRPMAGEFSPDGTVFLVGYQDGTIRQHDLQTGGVRTETYGALDTVRQVFPVGTEQFSLNGDLYSATNPNERTDLMSSEIQPQLTPDRTRAFVHSFDTAQIVDLVKKESLLTLKGVKGGQLSPDGKLLMTFHDKGEVHFWSTATGKHHKGWTFKLDPDDRTLSGYFTKDGRVVSFGHEGSAVNHWNPEDGTTAHSWVPEVGEVYAIGLSPDTSTVVVSGRDATVSWKLADGTTVFTAEKLPGSIGSRIYFKNDPGRFFFISYSTTVTVDAKTGKQLHKFEDNGVWSYRDNLDDDISPDGKNILRRDGTDIGVYDTVTGDKKFSLPLSSHVWDVAYTENGSRILTVDGNDGLTVWASDSPKKYCSMVLMKGDQSWLVYDEQGRYDATDPSNVKGAYFVMEWEKGLEAIEMPQLKSLFYEPGLLAKSLGLDKDPLREVPGLDSLKLFPEVKLEKNEQKIDISLEDRDNGGIGDIRVFLNGKLISTKKGSGFFSIDPSSYSQFLLPETHLAKGVGNVLSVEASNENRDLWSPPVRLDIGVPEGLKTPEVNMYALCVGIGDYVGSTSDLVAPPSDAIALSKALDEVSKKLLPNRVHVTTLTTDAKEATTRPSRVNILKWFEETSAKAKSTDIVFVFFAGHGTNKLGDAKGYYFMTQEADPGDSGALSASVGAISGDVLKDSLAKIPANKQVVILDTCHSGAAADSLIASDRSLSGDYKRAWEAIKDSTGTWMLAGAASDQLSYESTNVEHGMLTYSLLEALDKTSAEGLRASPSGEYFVDVERWLQYAANRVESLKSEVGLKGVQRPEFKRSRAGSSFDVGVLTLEKRGFLGLKPPKPVVILGEFEMDKEDPVGLEEQVRLAVRGSDKVKPWIDVAKHPNVYRIAGSYTLEGEMVKVKVYLQQFDDHQVRKTLETFELSGSKANLSALAMQVRRALEDRIGNFEAARKAAQEKSGRL